MNKNFKENVVAFGLKANKLGTFIISIISILVSELVYFIVALLLGIEDVAIGYIVAFIVPLIVATPASYFFLKITKIVQEQNQEIEIKNNIKNTLLSVLSHDVKGPFINLDSILDFYFAKEISTEELNNLLRELQTQVKSNINFLMSVLQWTKTQFNEFQINPIKLDIKEILQKIKKAYNYEIQQKNIELIIESNVIAKADKDLIRLIYRNLILNAIKFSEEGGKVQINVKIENNQLISEIIDFGMGMDKETLTKLFDENMLDSSRGTNKETGTGIGLKLCNAFVKAQGGRIWAESKKEAGSRFYFTIPQ